MTDHTPDYLNDPIMSPWYLKAAASQARADAQAGIHNNTWQLFSDARALYNTIHEQETRRIAADEEGTS